MKIVYLQHSGFVVETQQHLLVFDYYQDPTNSAVPMIAGGKKVIAFVSHSHSDHFNAQIGDWKDLVTTYYLSKNIRAAGGLPGVDSNKVVYMNPYEQQENSGLKVTTYGSTDAGLSFFVEVDGWRIFHAGDLNWWHWKGDTEENNRLAAAGFHKELERLAGVTMDVAFFPVDSRLEEYRALGVEAFCQQTKVHQLVAMHACGEVWTPPIKFPKTGKPVPVWCPATPGEIRQYNNKK